MCKSITSDDGGKYKESDSNRIRGNVSVVEFWTLRIICVAEKRENVSDVVV